MGLGTIWISQRLYKGVPIFFVFRDVMMKESEDRLVLSLDLAASFRMVRRSGEIFSNKEGA